MDTPIIAKRLLFGDYPQDMISEKLQEYYYTKLFYMRNDKELRIRAKNEMLIIAKQEMKKYGLEDDIDINLSYSPNTWDDHIRVQIVFKNTIDVINLTF